MTFNFTVKEFLLGGGTGTPSLQFYKRGFNLDGSATPSWQDVILSGNTALTLVNAKANSLEYLKLFGGCEQRNLPSGHQQLDYLQGDGTAYIETDVEPTNNTGMKIVFEYGSSDSAATSGIYTNTSPRQDTLFISTNTGSVDTSPVFCAHRGATLNSNSDYSEAPVSGKTYTININYKNSGTMGIEGFAQTPVGTEDALSNKVLLFARLNYSNNNITASTDKIKYVEFTEGTEVIRKYYPDSYNNELGLYDTITNTFLTNKNSSGTFTAGADVTTPSPDAPIDIVSNNGVVKVTTNLFDTESDWNINSSCNPNTTPATFPNTSGGNRYTFFFECKPNTSYTISWKTAGDRLFIGGLNTVVNPTEYTTPFSLEFDRNIYFISSSIPLSYTFTTNSTEKMIGIWYSLYTLPTDIVIRETIPSIYTDGTTETVEIDTTGDTATAENLFKVDTYQDVQSVIDGGVTRNVGVKVLDGAENWTASSFTAGKFFISTAVSEWNAIARDATGYCTHAVFNSSSSSGNGRVNFDLNSFCFYYSTSSTTLTEFKQFLSDQYNAGTPVIVVYPLATPTTETVTAQPMNIQAGTNIVEITEGSIDNLGLEVKYKATV
jgi:hypothetical protein